MWLYLVVPLALFVYIVLIKPHQFWKNKSVYHEKPTFFFGNVLDRVLGQTSFAEITQKAHLRNQNKRYFGFYSFLQPVLMVHDLDLIKQITVKDFDHFTDHTIFVPEYVDPLWTKNLFQTKGEKWRSMRATLSPSFTSSKMKMMFHLMVQCASQFSDHFLQRNEEIVTTEMKNTCTRFANDVIASCAFGINCDSFKNQDNEFYEKGSNAVDFTGLKSFKFFMNPLIMKIFNIKVFPNSTAEFFTNAVMENMKKRRQDGIVRLDMIHLLMEAQKGKLRDNSDDSKIIEENELLTDTDIVAQALIFFVAGFDTSSTLMTFITYELAVNPEIQEKLKAEIDTTLKNCNGKLSYDVLMTMEYLDMVVTETLRKWPPTPLSDRVCTKEYTIPPVNPGEIPVKIDVGTSIWFPIYGIQRNAEHFSNPDKFDPERFSTENKSNLNSVLPLTFGSGPRLCIGSRFALMEAKIIIVEILRHFEIVPVKETVIPVVLSVQHFNVQPENGILLGLKKRV